MAIACNAGTATDDRGVTLAFAQPPQRIVSLLPSLTETVCDLGHCERLLAVDTFSNWPDRVKALPHVGGLEDANIEMIVALKPDIVFSAVSSRAVGRLEALGLKVFAMEPKTLADVQHAMQRIGALLDAQPQAQAAWTRLQQGIDAAAASIPMAKRGQSVYFEVDPGPYAASEISHIGELLTRLGAANIVPGRLGSVPKLNPEFVLRADPQVIFIAERDAAGLVQRPGWSRIRAVRHGHVCAMSARDGDVIVRPGPRLADAARVLAACFAAPGTKRP